MNRHYNHIAGQSLERLAALSDALSDALLCVINTYSSIFEHRRHLPLAAVLRGNAPDSAAVRILKDSINDNGRPKGPAARRNAVGPGGYFRTGFT